MHVCLHLTVTIAISMHISASPHDADSICLVMNIYDKSKSIRNICQSVEDSRQTFEDYELTFIYALMYKKLYVHVYACTAFITSVSIKVQSILYIDT